MLTVQRAKSLQGKLTLPPSPDLFLLAAFAAAATGRPARIRPACGCPVARNAARALESLAAVTWENDACRIDPVAGGTGGDILFDSGALPYRDAILFLALSTGRKVLFRACSEKRLDAWCGQALRLGLKVDKCTDGNFRGLVLPGGTAGGEPPAVVPEADIQAALGLFWGLRQKRSFQTDFSLSTPLRSLAEVVGAAIEVKRDIGEAERDPILRRMKIQSGQRLSSQEQRFSITANFSGIRNGGELNLLLPGDEVLLAVALVLKSLVHKGSLLIENAPIEPWAAPVMTLMRKMGCKPSQQATHATAFGSCGMLSFPRFDLTGQKIEFAPQFSWAQQVPAMAILAAFAEGESVFRRFDDLRLNDPDGIRQLEGCLKLIGVKYGDIPDGFVIKGNRDYDGFDSPDPLPPYLAAALAAAGLHCMGSTTVNDELLAGRWPDFEKTIKDLCEFRTQ